MIKLITVPISEALIDVGINCGANLPHVIEIKNLNNEQIFRVLSEKRDCYFTIINNNCSCVQTPLCVHKQIVSKFKDDSAKYIEKLIQEYREELKEQDPLIEEDYQEHISLKDEQIQNQLQTEAEVLHDLRLGFDALDLDIDEIVRAEKCALREMEMDEYLEMDESMTYEYKMSYLRWHTCLAPRNHSIDPNGDQ